MALSIVRVRVLHLKEVENEWPESSWGKSMKSVWRRLLSRTSTQHWIPIQLQGTPLFSRAYLLIDNSLAFFQRGRLSIKLSGTHKKGNQRLKLSNKIMFHLQLLLLVPVEPCTTTCKTNRSQLNVRSWMFTVQSKPRCLKQSWNLMKSLITNDKMHPRLFDQTSTFRVSV